MYLLQARGKSLNLVLVLLFTLVGLWYSNVNIMHLNMEIYFSRSIHASSLFSFFNSMPPVRFFFYLSRYFLSRLSYTFCGRTRCIKTSANLCIHFTLPWKILRYFSYMVLPFFLQRFFCPVITFTVCMSLEKPGFWCARRKTRTRVLNERVVMRQIVEICSFDYNWIINKLNSLFSSDIAIVIFYGMKIISSIIFRGEIVPKMKKRRSLLYK